LAQVLRVTLETNGGGDIEQTINAHRGIDHYTQGHLGRVAAFELQQIVGR